MKNRFLAITAALAFAITASLSSVDALAAQTVKMSKSRICHDVSSPYYAKVKKYQPYASLQQCLAAGGRPPKTGGKANRAASAANASHDSAYVSGYRRELFGKGWDDADGDCRSTRHEILADLSTVKPTFKTSKRCRVTRGRWISPFTGDIHFDASKMDIDHIVPLAWGYHHGANQWSVAKRLAFANDPANLVPVEASLNRAKGARGLDEFLPPNNKCQYISRFERVLLKYGLTLTSREQDQYIAIKQRYCPRL